MKTISELAGADESCRTCLPRSGESAVNIEQSDDFLAGRHGSEEQKEMERVGVSPAVAREEQASKGKERERESRK